MNIQDRTIRKLPITNGARVVSAAVDAPISLREAARRLNVHLYAIQKRVKAGTLSTLPDGRLDWPTAEREWIQNRDSSQVRKTGALLFGNRSFLEAKTKREYLRLEREQLALSIVQGELAPIGEINAHVAGMIIRAREILTRMPAELKDRLAQESKPQRCEALINGEIERALRELREFQPRTAGEGNV